MEGFINDVRYDMDASILLGGITHHYLQPSMNYCSTINKYGTIANPYVIGLAGSSTLKAGFILGKDSSCGNILGPIVSYSLLKNLEFIAGGYNANFDSFEGRGMKPIQRYGVTPILGLDYRVFLRKNVSIDTLVSYGIITHSLRIDF